MSSNARCIPANAATALLRDQQWLDVGTNSAVRRRDAHAFRDCMGAARFDHAAHLDIHSGWHSRCIGWAHTPFHSNDIEEPQ